jgi:hypothetical protein
MIDPEAMKQLKRALENPTTLETMADMSKFLYMKYQTLLKAGFTEEQAMDIITSLGIGWGA